MGLKSSHAEAVSAAQDPSLSGRFLAALGASGQRRREAPGQIEQRSLASEKRGCRQVE